jgi:hypothetical protein
VSTLSTINKIADYIEAYQEGRTLAPSPTFSQLMLS